MKETLYKCDICKQLLNDNNIMHAGIDIVIRSTDVSINIHHDELCQKCYREINGEFKKIRDDLKAIMPLPQ
jgi:hypothetical protein